MTKLGNQIEKDILKVINNLNKPVSSRELALNINRAWHSVNTHCLRLQIDGKIFGYKIGNLNVWSAREL